MPGHENDFPAGVLVFVGQPSNGGVKFIVRPGRNEHNRWFWGEPTTPLRSPSWAKTLKKLPAEGFYTLPRAITFENGGRWLENAIVQLGYNQEGKGIAFVGEQREGSSENALYFSARGSILEDSALEGLRWAPILPASATPSAQS